MCTSIAIAIMQKQVYIKEMFEGIMTIWPVQKNKHSTKGKRKRRRNEGLAWNRE